VIVVVGSVNIDLVVQVPRLPKVGETLLGSDYALHHGGKGGNQATAAARAGAQVRLVAKAGIDAFADKLIDGLAAEGIDVHAVQRVAQPSGVAFINVLPGGDNSIIVAPGANADLGADDLEVEWFEGASVVMMQLEVPLEVVLEAARLGKEAGAITVLNLSPAVRLDAEQLKHFDVLLVNESEAAVQLGNDDVEAETAVRELATQVPMAVLTVGERGAYWAGDGRHGHVPARQAQVTDTTGAGDAFAGAFAARLSDGISLEEAVRFGVIAGGLATERSGAQASMPELEEIEAALNTQD